MTDFMFFFLFQQNNDMIISSCLPSFTIIISVYMQHNFIALSLNDFTFDKTLRNIRTYIYIQCIFTYVCIGKLRRSVSYKKHLAYSQRMNTDKNITMCFEYIYNC